MADMLVGHVFSESKPRIILTNLQDILQFVLIVFIYMRMYGREYTSAFMLIIGVYLAATFVNHIFFQPITVLQNYNWTLAGLIVIFMSIGWMLHVLITLPVKKLIWYGEFWINTAFFCYFSISLFIFLSVNYVFKNQSFEAKTFLWSFHNVNNVMKNVLLSIGIYYFGDRFASNKYKAHFS
jgi:hypothetical protein